MSDFSQKLVWSHGRAQGSRPRGCRTLGREDGPASIGGAVFVLGVMLGVVLGVMFGVRALDRSRRHDGRIHLDKGFTGTSLARSGLG
jgi:hypothetical protein